MRISVSHRKSKQEVIRTINDAVEQALSTAMPGPAKIMNMQKAWNGNVMNFSFNASMGLLSAPITGSIEVTDTDVIVDVNLPSILGRLIPESTVRSGIENKVRGLLT
jgi:hypothetical protein